MEVDWDVDVEVPGVSRRLAGCLSNGERNGSAASGSLKRGSTVCMPGNEGL